MLKIQVNLNMQPPLVITDMPMLMAPPQDRYAYARSVLYAAVNGLGICVDRMDLKRKLIPAISIEMPTPPLFNAFYEPGLIFNLQTALSGDSNHESDIAGLFQNAEQQGEAQHGTISISDAMATTVLYLSQTRRYLFQAIQMIAPSELPDAVLVEIGGLFSAWDKWHPKQNLDLSKSQDVPPIPTDAKPEDLTHLVFANSPDLFCILFFVLCHEYGHLLMDFNQDIRQNYSDKARFSLEDLIAGEPIRNSIVSPYYQLLKDPDIFASWQNELGADILALELIMQLLFKEIDSISKALAMLSLVQTLLEVYFTKKHSGFSSSHPLSSMRYFLWMDYLIQCLGWDRGNTLRLCIRVESALLAFQVNQKLQKLP